jgi:ArsR family transcriptional regulator, arsenate/arsenite/antimonite-responsive transcriptional repressor
MNRQRQFDFPLFFKALADQTRLRLLNLIGDREVCVCYFVEILGTHQPKISRHLAYLRDAGIVNARREGKWMHYRIAEPSNPIAKHMLGEILEWLKSDSRMQAERAKLEGICCAPRPPVRLKQAPVPRLTQITRI